MAIPFGLKKESEEKEKQREDVSNNSEKMQYVKQSCDRLSETCEISFRFQKENSAVNERSEKLATNIYHVSNPKFANYNPTIINVIDRKNVKNDMLCMFNKSITESSRKIKVRKGVFDSTRIINAEDIHIIAEDLRHDWRKLLKMLPGVTFNNSSFHQTFIDAMDRNESTNMAEITLRTWKCALPEFSTIGNLAKTLFRIEHPDLVTYLKP